MSCKCCIVPIDVLDRLSADRTLGTDVRKALSDTARVSSEIRKLRTQAGLLTIATQSLGMHFAELAAKPDVAVYDCQHGQTLPGSAVPNPQNSADPTAQRAFGETSLVADFYQQVFNRNSIDNGGMTLMSSIHYGTRFNNAMWNGTQMLYGDGDGQIFIDFTNGNDVIGHELTHGVTQHTLQLAYANDAGGLNESVSDCFGSIFRQWQAKQDVTTADWLIGSDIMGPAAKAKGYTCLRDMANPAAAHCLAAQPSNYSQITPGMDPHYSSGPPNLAFCLACKKAGGNSWDTVGKVWYQVLTGSGPHPTMAMKEFADRTRQVAGQLFSGNPAVGTAIDSAWKQVGL